MSSSSGHGHGHGHSQARKVASKGRVPQSQASAVAGAGAATARSGSSSSSRTAKQQQHQAPKSGSRLKCSEDLVAAMKSYGYVPPKQQQPDHYDYLFQDKEMVAFLQKFTSRITDQNVIGHEEMVEIQQLKAENRAVYGKDLEALLAKSRQDRQAELDRVMARDEHLQELKQRIQEKKESIERLKAFEPKINARRQKETAKKALIAYQTELIDNDCQRLRKELNSGRDEQKECKAKCVAIVQQKLREHDAPSMIVRDVTNQCLQVEDEIRDRMKVKVDVESDLLKQSMTPYELIRRFEQYGKDMERLKHVIIHEIIQKVENDCIKEVMKALTEKVPGFKKENERAVRLTEDVRRKMGIEKLEAIVRIWKSLKEVKDRKLNQLRANLVKKFQEETRLIQLQKYESRNQIQSHFKAFADCLMPQFTALLISDGLVTLKNMKAAQFIDCLKNFSTASQQLKLERHALKCPITEANLPPEKQAIAKLFKTHRISLELLRSRRVTKYVLSQLRLRARHLARREEEAKINSGSLKVKALFGRFKNSSDQWEMNGKVREKWDDAWHELRRLGKKVKHFEEKTRAHFMTKENAVTRAIEDKENLLEEAKEFLQERRTRVEEEEAAKKAEAEAEAEAEASAAGASGQQQRRRRSSLSIVGYSHEVSFTSSLQP